MSLLKPLWYQRTLPLSLFSPFVFASRANPRSIYSMFWFVKGVSGDFHGQRRHLKASMEERWDLGRLKRGKSAFRAAGSRQVQFYFLDLRRSAHGDGAWPSGEPPPPWIYCPERRWDKQRSGVTVGGRWFWSSVFVDSASQGFNLNRGVYWGGDLCNGYAVVLHFPASAMVSRSGPTAESHAIGN